MAAGLGVLILDDFRGGRNGADALTAIPDGQCAEAINVDWHRGRLGRRRAGALDMVPPVSTASLESAIYSLIRFTPSRTETQTELFAFDRAGTIGHFRSGLGWMGQSHGGLDLTSGLVHGVSFNNKLFVAGRNTADALHYWSAADNTIYPVGMPAPPAPLVAPDIPAGTITGTRYYRVSDIDLVGVVVAQRSEMSAVASYALVNGSGWRVTRVAPMAEYGTHWEVYAGATATGPWYLIATNPIATATVVDTVPIAGFPPPNVPLSPIIGSNTPAPNGKYLLVDESRLLIAGHFTDPTLESRVTWTPVLNDASGAGNDERINAADRPFIDFDPGDGGEITGLGGPLYDSPYVFKLDRIYKMVRTGLAAAPYRPVTITKKHGALHHRTVILGEDETGNDALYFLSRRGPYRVGINGVQYCGRDVEDVWATVNLNTAVGTDTVPPAHGLYHADLHQVWWWVPTGDSPYPNLKLVFDVRQGQFVSTEGVRRGWALHTGASAAAWSSTVYADTVSTPITPDTDSLRLKPYIGQVSEATIGEIPDGPRVWMTDIGTTDNGQPYIAALVSAGLMLSGHVARHGGVLEAHAIIGPALDGARRFLLASIGDYGREIRLSSPVPFSHVEYPGDLSRVVAPVRDLAAVSAAVVQIRFEDFSDCPAWELDQIVLRVRREEDR
jgi:hypothetical protein